MSAWEDEIDEEDFVNDLGLFDVSDITLDFQQVKKLNRIYLIMKSEEPINLMRFYLKLKEYIFQMEAEIGVMDDIGGEH